jgi:hypothetical protein
MRKEEFKLMRRQYKRASIYASYSFQDLNLKRKYQNDTCTTKFHFLVKMMMATAGLGIFIMPGVIYELGAQWTIVASLLATIMYSIGSCFWLKDLEICDMGDVNQGTTYYIIVRKSINDVVAKIFTTTYVIGLGMNIIECFSIFNIYLQDTFLFLFEKYNWDQPELYTRIFTYSMIGGIVAIYFFKDLCVLYNSDPQKEEAWNEKVDYFRMIFWIGALLIPILLLIELLRRPQYINDFAWDRWKSQLSFLEFCSLFPKILYAIQFNFLNQHVLLKYAYKVFEARKTQNKRSLVNTGDEEDAQIKAVEQLILKPDPHLGTYVKIPSGFRILFLTQLAIFILIVATGLIGVLMFDIDTNGVIQLASLSPFQRLVCGLAIGIFLVSYVPTVIKACVQLIFTIFVCGKNNMKEQISLCKNMGARIPLYLVIGLLGIFQSHVIVICRLISNFVTPWIIYIMPSLCFLNSWRKISGMAQGNNAIQLGVDFYPLLYGNMIIAFFLIVFSLTILVVSFAFSAC